MTDPSEPEALTVRAARARFFDENGFGSDGGYAAAWGDAELGPFHYRVPNHRARSRALRTHDLHHIATGYPTDWGGEAEISAWELGGGLGREPYAWVIALFGVLTGLLARPLATWRAFVRGRRSANLYGAPDVEAWLDRPLASLTRHLRVPPAAARLRAHPYDVGAFAAVAGGAALFGVVAAPFVVGFVAAGELRHLGLTVCSAPATVSRA